MELRMTGFKRNPVKIFSRVMKFIREQIAFAYQSLFLLKAALKCEGLGQPKPTVLKKFVFCDLRFLLCPPSALPLSLLSISLRIWLSFFLPFLPSLGPSKAIILSSVLCVTKQWHIGQNSGDNLGREVGRIYSIEKATWIWCQHLNIWRCHINPNF